MSKRTDSIIKGKFTKNCTRTGGVADYIYVDDFTCSIDGKEGEFTVKSITIGEAFGGNVHKGNIIDFSKAKQSDFADFMPENLYNDNFEQGRGYVMYFDPKTHDFEEGQCTLFRKFLANFAPVISFSCRTNEDYWRAKNRKLVIR